MMLENLCGTFMSGCVADKTFSEEASVTWVRTWHRGCFRSGAYRMDLCDSLCYMLLVVIVFSADCFHKVCLSFSHLAFHYVQRDELISMFVMSSWVFGSGEKKKKTV